MRRTRIFATALLAAVVGCYALAYAQSVNVSASVAWTAPTVDANGLSLAGTQNVVTSYNVYASTVPLTAAPAGPPIAVVTAPSTAVTGAVSANVGDTLYLYVAACNPTGCGKLSQPGTKLVTAPAAPPGTPTNVTITVTITPSS